MIMMMMMKAINDHWPHDQFLGLVEFIDLFRPRHLRNATLLAIEWQIVNKKYIYAFPWDHSVCITKQNETATMSTLFDNQIRAWPIVMIL